MTSGSNGLRARLTSPAAKKAWVFLAALVVVALWGIMVERAFHGSSQWDDFTGFARDLVYRGINVYEEYPPGWTIVKYPPFFGLLFAPLVPLPGWLAASLWYWLNLALAVGATWLAVATVDEGPRGRRLPTPFYLVPFLLIFGIVGSNLVTAQVNIVIVFLVYLALFSFERHHEATGGLVLGVATALKLTPGLFILYFAWKRAWRLVGASLVGLALCWGVVLPVVLGVGDYAAVMEAWLHDLVPFLAEGTVAEGIGGFRHTNQSLSAFLHRTLTRTPAGAGREGLYLNVAALDRETVSWMVKGVAGVLLLFLGWISRASIDVRRDLRLSFEYALVMIATLFLSPISWINHYVILLFPLTLAVYYIRTRPDDDPRRRAMWWTLAAGFVLLLGAAARITQALSLPFLGAAVIFGGLAWVLRRETAARVGE